MPLISWSQHIQRMLEFAIFFIITTLCLEKWLQFQNIAKIGYRHVPASRWISNFFLRYQTLRPPCLPHIVEKYHSWGRLSKIILWRLRHLKSIKPNQQAAIPWNLSQMYWKQQFWSIQNWRRQGNREKNREGTIPSPKRRRLRWKIAQLESL